eukprot:TRINITY_DN2626_c0_g1_i1.p1 TRINITY_DN2626_c0_g1~~TRINITY_DN2626_c0_g1_i1.p1  ORF type:complete len:1221 (+),score=334.34 TRINITY_DN2626_c0_g1_i1:256-3918(+)
MSYLSKQVTSNDVADFLVKNHYHLSALEFHQELAENGEVVQLLKDHFEELDREIDGSSSSPSGSKTFSSSSDVSSGKSDGGAPLSPADYDELLRKKDESLSLFQYDLRMARQDTADLREEVAKLREANRDGQASNGGIGIESAEGGTELPAEELRDLDDTPLSRYERRALSFVIRQALVAQGFRLSAATLSEEVSDQDLNDWRDVAQDGTFARDGTSDDEDDAVSTALAPPALSTYFRYFYRAGPNKTLLAAQTLSNDLTARNAVLEKEALERERQLRTAAEAVDRLTSEQISLKEKFASGTMQPSAAGLKALLTSSAHLHEGNNSESTAGQNGSVDDSTDGEKNSAAAASTTAIRPKKRRRPLLCPPPKAIKGCLVDDNSRIGDEISKIVHLNQDSDLGEVVSIVADCLPHIVPGVLLNKREELIPVFLVVLWLHPDASVRDALTRLLFNVIKKPDEAQRKVIMDGCIALASLVGPLRTEIELFPQCWEQISDQREERRVLVAESCGSLSGYVKPDLRASLILSILNQMTDDRSALVRESVARNLAILIRFFANGDKYQTVQELLLRLLYDSDTDVVHTAQVMLLPTVASWAHLLNRLTGGEGSASRMGLSDKLLSELRGVVRRSDSRGLDGKAVARASLLMSSIAKLLPQLWQALLVDSPYNEDDPVTVAVAKAEARKARKEKAALKSMKKKEEAAAAAAAAAANDSDKNGDGEDDDSSSDSVHVDVTVEEDDDDDNDEDESEDENSDGDQEEDSTTFDIEEASADDTSLLSSDREEALARRVESFLATWGARQRSELDDGVMTPSGDTGDDEREMWPSLHWVTYQYMPQLLDLVCGVDLETCRVLYQKIIGLVHQSCSTFGNTFTREAVVPLMQSLMLTSISPPKEGTVSSVVGKNLSVSRRRSLLLAIHVCGVLATLDMSDVVKYLHEVIVNVSLEEYGWSRNQLDEVRDTLSTLFERARQDSDDNVVAAIIELMWELVVHPATQVRAAISQLFKLLINVASSTQVVKRILPALITLSNDMDKVVRFHSVQPLGAVAVSVSEDQILEKVNTQFDLIMDDSSAAISGEVVLTFGQIIPNVKANFRDAYLLPKLVEMTKLNNHNKDTTGRTEMAQRLFESYRAFNGCLLSAGVIRDGILPGLKYLLKDASLLDPSYKAMIQSMIKDMTAALKYAGNGEDDSTSGDGDEASGHRRGPSGTTEFAEQAKSSLLNLFSSST